MIQWKRFAIDRKRHLFAFGITILALAGLFFAVPDAMAKPYALPAAGANPAQRVIVRYYGRDHLVTTQGETVLSLLRRVGLEPKPGDRLSQSPECPTWDKMEIRVDRVVRRQETYTAVVGHETVYCDDPALPQGQEQVLVGGVDGELLRRAAVTYVNGQETHREILSEAMTRAPVTQIVAVGTGQSLQAAREPGLEIGEGYIRLPTGEVLTYTSSDTVRATAYTHTDAGCSRTTYTGTTVRRGTVAVDPRFIPYGTRMFIVSNDGAWIYGIGVAEDCGGAIKRDRIDLYFPTHQECIQFGRRSCTVYFLG